MRIYVECYAGFKADERPRKFLLMRASESGAGCGSSPAPQQGHWLEVQEILDRWYGPDHQCFRVRADDSNLYVLRHDFEHDIWLLDSFRAERGRPK